MFKTGRLGLGYYADAVHGGATAAMVQRAKLRRRRAGGVDGLIAAFLDREESDAGDRGGVRFVCNLEKAVRESAAAKQRAATDAETERVEAAAAARAARAAEGAAVGSEREAAEAIRWQAERTEKKAAAAASEAAADARGAMGTDSGGMLYARFASFFASAQASARGGGDGGVAEVVGGGEALLAPGPVPEAAEGVPALVRACASALRRLSDFAACYRPGAA